MESVAQQLDVQKQVLVRLKELSAISYNTITSNKDSQSFWEAVDNLPIEQAMELHRLQLEIPTTCKDFEGDFLTPCLEEYYYAYCEENGITEQKVAKAENKVLTKEVIIEILSKLKGWNDTEDDSWTCGKVSFTIDTLYQICEARLKGENVWEFYEPFKECYTEAIKFLNEQNKSEDEYQNIITRMNEFRYITANDLKNDIEKIVGKNSGVKLPPLKEPRSIADGLRKLTNEVAGKFEEDEEPETASDLRSTSEYARARVKALVDAAARPIERQRPFEVTGPVLAARAGSGPSEGVLEPGSLEELLFGSASGEIAPLPYSAAGAEIPSGPTPTFVRDATRRYTALLLSDLGFVEAPGTALEMLTDVVGEGLREIAANVALMTRPSQAPKETVRQAIFKFQNPK